MSCARVNDSRFLKLYKHGELCNLQQFQVAFYAASKMGLDSCDPFSVKCSIFRRVLDLALTTIMTISYIAVHGGAGFHGTKYEREIKQALRRHDLPTVLCSKARRNEPFVFILPTGRVQLDFQPLQTPLYTQMGDMGQIHHPVQVCR